MSSHRRVRSGSMFLRMLTRAAMLRKGSAIAALLATTVAAAAATAMLNLVVDVQGKLRTEFRHFGANIVVEGKGGGTLTADARETIWSAVNTHGLLVPFAYAVARTDKDQPIVVAGTDLEVVQKLNPWWSVSSWPKDPGQALVGVRAAKLLISDGPNFSLAYQGRVIHLEKNGTVSTGAGEDSRVYLSLQEFRSWTGLDPSIVEIGASGSTQEVNSLLQRLQQDLPNSQVHAVRQVMESEANVLGKTRSTLFASSAFIACTAALCVLATLMGWVFDRRRDFAIMKALGASDRLISLFMAGEAVILAAVGSIFGFVAGAGIAAWIGRVNFHAPVALRLDIFPWVLAGCLAVTLLATTFPLRLMRRIQPAMILRGE